MKVSITIDAVDEFETANMRKATYKGDFAALIPAKRDKTGGLATSLHLVHGMRIMLKRNIEVRNPQC